MDDNKTTNVFKTLMDLNKQKDSVRLNPDEIKIPKAHESYGSDTYKDGFINGWETAYSEAIQIILSYFAEQNNA